MGVSEHVVVTKAFLLGGLNKGRITISTLEAITQRRKAPASTRHIIKHVSGVIQLFRDTREETNVTLKGESSLVLLRGNIESVADRGITVPDSVRNAPIQNVVCSNWRTLAPR